MAYDPERWLSSAIENLQAYAEDGFNNAVMQGVNPVGNSVYEVVMEFPSPELQREMVPLPKTFVHFATDEITQPPIGFGEIVGANNFDEPTWTIRPQEAKMHTLNFDVGIWSSDASGGVSSRMRAYEILDLLFLGARATRALYAATDGGDGGLELLRYSGGRFVQERINDLTVYRMIGAELEIRVFSRTPQGVAEGAIEDFVVAPNLTIPE